MLDVICRIGRQLGRRFSAMQPLHTLRVIQQHPVLQIHDPLRRGQQLTLPDVGIAERERIVYLHTENFGLWPEFSRVILVLLMLIGACAGSTGGGLKISRLVILVKTVQREVRLLLHPRTVKVMTIDGKPLSNDTVRGVSAYFLTYVFLIVISILLVSLDGFDGSTTITAVFATVNNIGPGLGMVDPAGSYAAFSPLAKVVLTLDMLFGRLELYPMLILMLPTTWTRRR